MFPCGNVVISTTEYYSVMNRNEMPIHATVWMNLANVLLGKARQTQKVASDSTYTRQKAAWWLPGA